jgi:hypothetical protein
MKDNFPDTEPVLFREPFERKCELRAQIEQLRELNAEFLRALKYTRLFVGQPTPVSEEIDELIAKAEKLK